MIVVYWLAGLRETAGAFFTFVLIFFVVIITAQSYGFVISTVTPTFEVASIFVPVCMVIIMLFGGFYLVSERRKNENKKKKGRRRSSRRRGRRRRRERERREKKITELIL